MDLADELLVACAEPSQQPAGRRSCDLDAAALRRVAKAVERGDHYLAVRDDAADVDESLGAANAAVTAKLSVVPHLRQRGGPDWLGHADDEARRGVAHSTATHS